MKWVTRERPKIDRIACPWLIARFIDKAPEFAHDDRAAAAKYIDAFFQNLKWGKVNARLGAAGATKT